MKASKHLFAVILLILIIMLYKRCFLLMNLWMKSYGVAIQMKPAEHFFAVVLFIMLYKVVLTF